MIFVVFLYFQSLHCCNNRYGFVPEIFFKKISGGREVFYTCSRFFQY